MHLRPWGAHECGDRLACDVNLAKREIKSNIKRLIFRDLWRDAGLIDQNIWMTIDGTKKARDCAMVILKLSDTDLILSDLIDSLQ